jgi:uncharacterized protein YndB with AHSA1/START domain
MMHGALSIEPRGDREILITRSFNAPRALVWRAMTEPPLVKQWLGVFGGWTLPVCEIDARAGGMYRYEWHNRNGSKMGMGGVITECTPPERMVATELFDDPWYPGGAVTTQVLTEQGGQTLLTMTITYASKEARDGVVAGPMATGMAASYDAFEALVVTLVKEGK